MKKLSITLLAILFLTSNISLAAAELKTNIEVNYKGVKRKFKRGVVNIFTSPAEIPKQVKEEWKNSEDKSFLRTFSVVGGFFKGIAYTAGRFSAGFYDVLTMNVKYPDGYESLIQPEYVFDDLKESVEGGTSEE